MIKSINLITRELYEQKDLLPKKLMGTVVDSSSTKDIVSVFGRRTTEEINIYDLTYNQDIKTRELIHVNDHINQTGTNPLVGWQHKLGIEFIDLTNLYKRNKKGIITTAVGGGQSKNGIKYPTRYLCHITIVARAIGVKSITAKLVNSQYPLGDLNNPQ